MDFGDATATIIERDCPAGTELWSVIDQGRLWTAYHETYVFCRAHQQSCNQAWLYRGHRYAANTQTTMLIEPGEIHRTIRGSPSSFYLLFLQPQAVMALLDSRHLHFHAGQTAEAIVLSQFAQLTQVIARNPGDQLAKEESVLRFLHMLSNVCAERTPMPRHTNCHRAVTQVRGYLHDHYGDNLQLDDLASIAGLSKYHLTRLFQRKVGVPLHRYRTLVRVAKSRELLLRGKSICDVAGEVGFYDQSHFHQAFFNTYGMTPRRFLHPLT